MTFLERVCAVLGEAGVPFAVVGGHAVALHGAVRGTVDVDVALTWSEDSVAKAEAALQTLGLVSQLPLTAADVVAHRERYVAERRLLAWHFYNPRVPLEQVDILVDYDLAGSAVQRIATDHGRVPVLALPDLIAMKQASGRAQDVEDAKALEKLK